MHTSKLTVRASLIVALLAITAFGVTKAGAEDEPGRCGEYKYWQDGQCVDARNKADPAWVDRMMSRPVW